MAVRAQSQAADTLPAAADTIASTLDTLREQSRRLTDLVDAGDVLFVLLLLAATFAAIRLVSVLTHVVAGRLPRQRILILQLLPVARMALWLIAAYAIVVLVFNPSAQALLAFSATAGIGIGFAAQDVLKNIFGGLVIVIDRPFQVGDLVDIGSHHGEVIAIGLRATRLRTRDDTVVSVPNAEVVSQAVANANAGALDCMVVTELFLPALVDARQVRRIAYEAAATSPYVHPGKPIRVRIRDEFRETFLTAVRIKAYVYDHRLETAFATDVAGRAKRAFLEQGLPPELTLGVDGDEYRRFLARAGGAAGAVPAGGPPRSGVPGAGNVVEPAAAGGAGDAATGRGDA